ncbi:Adenine phosphoribosyltransferase [Smittium culicis]|uniref:adenine phosphoribosyltransferase n=1 Tax=Smittium culicis TaxID=133412 RepID=A0A1R1YHI3_9FUNG|nr:Adenine phosphoribosyltransferase [Smittium culicis]OMJ26343.1 Adenine phosphoribosyltransferase [Smittium culicis]
MSESNNSQEFTIEKVKALVADYQDFPKEGILFRDIFPIFLNPQALDCLLNHMVKVSVEFASKLAEKKIHAVVGLDARGFLFGPTLALKLNAKFVPIRKSGKLPGTLVNTTYEKEYGADTVEIQSNSILNGENVLIVDDLLATGGTCRAAEELIAKLGANVVLNLFVIELSGLSGRSILKSPIHSVIEYE